MIDYKDYVNPDPTPDPDVLQLAIDVKTMRGTVNAKVGEAIVIMLDGVYIIQPDQTGYRFVRIHDPLQA